MNLIFANFSLMWVLGMHRDDMMMGGTSHEGASELVFYALYIFLQTLLVIQLVMQFPGFIEAQVIPCPQKLEMLLYPEPV
jgi:hypothetical protein